MRKFVLLGLLIMTSCAPQDPWSETRTEIRQVFEVPLVEMDFRQVIYHSKDREWWNILDSKREALFVVPVRVQAGFNLKIGFSVESLGTPRSVDVVFPPPTILMADADDSAIQQYYSLPASGSVTPQELQSLMAQAVDSAQKEALQAGILDKARNNAQDFLNTFFGILGFDTVVLRIKEEGK